MHTHDGVAQTNHILPLMLPCRNPLKMFKVLTCSMTPCSMDDLLTRERAAEPLALQLALPRPWIRIIQKLVIEV